VGAFSFSLTPPAAEAPAVAALTDVLQAIKQENWKRALTLLGELPQGAISELKRQYLQQQIGYLEADLGTLRETSSPRLLPHLYLNVGCGYHNLMLWMREVEGTSHEPFFQKAQFSYELAFHSDFEGSYAVARVCLAALYMEQGMLLAASDLMDTLELEKLQGYIELMNIAYYYSAAGQAELAVSYLKKAMVLRPDETREWAIKSNDFDRVRNDVRFQQLIQ
jgi:tetratricopeptide (TPR) repeat protein